VFEEAETWGVPVAVAVLVIDRLSRSAWVVVKVAVQVSEAAGARVGIGQVTVDKPGMGSVMPTEDRVMSPVLDTA
jgi:hypothetical protein